MALADLIPVVANLDNIGAEVDENVSYHHSNTARRLSVATQPYLLCHPVETLAKLARSASIRTCHVDQRAYHPLRTALIPELTLLTHRRQQTPPCQPHLLRHAAPADEETQPEASSVLAGGNSTAKRLLDDFARASELPVPQEYTAAVSAQIHAIAAIAAIPIGDIGPARQWALSRHSIQQQHN